MTCPVQSLEERIIAHGSRAWTIEEFRSLWNMSKSGVYKMINEGRLPAMGKGSNIRICPTEVWEYYQTMVAMRH